LVAIDFSEESTEAASWGFSIAQQCQADVTLLHVADFIMGDIPNRYKHALLEGIRLELEQLIPAEIPSDCTTRVESGMPYQVILKFAVRGKADVIVLGTHGKSMLDRTLLGTAAERVIRGASCPVLSVPPKPQKNTRR
jgi:nucleotide-binding universal stress UspA family protein